MDDDSLVESQEPLEVAKRVLREFSRRGLITMRPQKEWTPVAGEARETLVAGKLVSGPTQVHVTLGERDCGHDPSEAVTIARKEGKPAAVVLCACCPELAVVRGLADALEALGVELGE